MIKTIPLATLCTVLISSYAHSRAIYGDDNRTEVSKASTFEQKLAHSAATMVGKSEIRISGSKATLNQRTFKEWIDDQMNKSDEGKGAKSLSKGSKEVLAENLTFCEEERFISQPNPGMCSGFLIAPDLIVTAGHCVDTPSSCSDYRWVFDFTVSAESGQAGVDIPVNNIYECKEVLSQGLNMPLGLDYAIVKLDRRVEGREPLEIRNDGMVKNNTDLILIGSPSGLPLKVAAGAKVRSGVNPSYFVATVDAFQGNSGSGVFNAQTGVVEGILVRGENDFVLNKEKNCIESNKCAEDSCRGEDVTRLTAIPEIGIQVALNQAAESGDVESIEKLLKLNVWVDFYGKDGESALFKAVVKNQLEAAKLLIAKGADVNLRNAKGVSLLEVSKTLKNKNLTKFLKVSGAR